jgi:hypothetical protein
MPTRVSRLAQRRICAAMVLVWLFAVFTSAAHACILLGQPQPGTQAVQAGGPDAAADHSHHHPAAAHEHLFHDAADAGDDATHPAATDHHPSCAKFCQDEGATLTKHSSLDNPLDLLPGLLATGGTPVSYPPATAVGRRETQRPQAAGPPLALRFLRLTL